MLTRLDKFENFECLHNLLLMAFSNPLITLFDSHARLSQLLASEQYRTYVTKAQCKYV